MLSLPPLIKFRVGDFGFSRDRDFRKIREAFWVRGGTGIFPVTCVLKRFPRTSSRNSSCREQNGRFRARHHVGGTKWPDEVAPPTTCMAGRSHASMHFLLLTGSCVDVPRHGSAQSWVIRMPGFIRKQESKRLSSSGRGEPLPTAPRRPGGR